ncbi:MAG: hypothetical protein M3N51_05070 [Actinomycetota bacterium]|nr:hypothetical protein [Actinomycetota bacterium]
MAGRWRILWPALLLAACSTPPQRSLSTPAASDTTAAARTTATASPTSTSPTGDSRPTATSNPQATLPSDLLAEIEELQQAAEQARGLEFLQPPEVTVATDQELAERVRELLEEDLPADEVAVDQALLKLLGLLESGTDLRALYQDLYAEQVAGFYDGDTQELVVGSAVQGLSPLTKVTLVHELVHALTDQHFDFHETFVRLDDEEHFDQASAYQALIEGDATFYQLVYLQELPRSQQLEVAVEAAEQETQVFNRAPRFLRELLLFPYDTGNTLVAVLVREGGTERVNSAYQDRPVSTEQVLHPELYLEGEGPLEVELGETELPGYEVAEESVWGELGFQVMLADVLETGPAAPAAAGWGGDRYRVLWDGEEVAMAIRYRGDTEDDAVELHDHLVQYVERAMAIEGSEQDTSGTVFTGDSYAFLSRSGDEVLLIVASDPQAGEELRDQL